VARTHEVLFPLNTPASANAALNRLLNTLNAAAAQGIAFTACITADKKGGAQNRQVWFDGALAAPAPAHMAELDAILPGQLVTDQLGQPMAEAPVVVLITFNPDCPLAGGPPVGQASRLLRPSDQAYEAGGTPALQAYFG